VIKFVLLSVLFCCCTGGPAVATQARQPRCEKPVPEAKGGPRRSPTCDFRCSESIPALGSCRIDTNGFVGW
jgi:hypothetical protein